MLTYSIYEYDARVKRYAESLADRGDLVDVISLKTLQQPLRTQMNGMHIYRIQSRDFSERSPLSYLLRILYFFFKSIILLSYLSAKQKYDIIHIHSVPDFLVFTALLPKFLGAKIILDIHDILPEFYQRKFNVPAEHVSIRFLRTLERLSCKFSDHIIIANHLWREKIAERSVQHKKCSVFINTPDPRIFGNVRATKNKNQKFRLLYHGNLGEHFGVDIAIKAMDKITEDILNAELFVLSGKKNLDNLQELVDELDLRDYIYFTKEYVPVEEVPKYVSDADVGIVPQKDGVFSGDALSTKLLEYVFMGIPVVASRLNAFQIYFDDSMLSYFEPGNPKDLARAVLDLYRNPRKKQQLLLNADRFNKKYNWERYKAAYHRLIDNLCTKAQ
ncbi:MAG: glycosyltransferase family 4 protein [Candidatus Hodarchaeota archaeon]